MTEAKMLPTPYQQFIHLSRYARWNEELGRRETWEETVERYVDFFDELTDRKHTEVLKGRVKEAILDLKVMPSMRAMMTAGEALKREGISQYNCFRGDTEYMTLEGVKTFADTMGTTQKVLAGDGEWRDAEIKSFGVQKLVDVGLHVPGFRSALRYYVTPDHRWITTNRGEVTDLRLGDVIPFNPACGKDFESAVVMSMQEVEEAEVFCAVEPVTTQFTLAEGLLTGNCSYLAVNTTKAFSEALYVLMCGTGVGFSCERQEIAKLPVVPDVLTPSDEWIVVGDSKEGWAQAVEDLISALYHGRIPQVDYSLVRPAGARLRTFGGRASGPEPLRRLVTFVTSTFKHAAGRKLNSIEVHDIMCMIGEIVVVGGVRRSALISLSNLSDQRMRDAKSGQWWEDNAQRALANNSVAYTEKPSMEVFMEEWLSLVKSKSGERGIFNRVAAQKQASKWGRREVGEAVGTNPCVSLRSFRG